MTLAEAIDVIGGSEAAKLLGINRTTILYWRENGAPSWRTVAVQRLIRAAEKKQAKEVA